MASNTDGASAHAGRAASPAKKPSVKKAPHADAPAKKSVAKKAPATKTPATKSTAGATKSTQAQTATKRTAPKRKERAPPAVPAEPTSLRVREDESPWTSAELAEVRAELEQDVTRLNAEIVTAETGLHELLRDSGDGAGDDQADAGAKTFEREQEISLANNSREMLEQSLRAVGAIVDGTYGICESCGLPVGKMRLQAFPRATLCVSCKQRQERR